MPKRNIFRVKMKCFLIVFNSPIILILFNPCKPTNLISTHYKRIPVNGRITVIFSSLIIIQVDLGKPSEKIGFIQVGFCIDHLIKILNGKDIVLKV